MNALKLDKKNHEYPESPNNQDHTLNSLQQESHLKYKTLMVLSESFLCDIACPYCTAKITRWPTKWNDHWEKLQGILQMISDKWIFFEYLTISWNWEPSKYDIDTLKLWRKKFDYFKHLFEYMRFQTSWNIFYENDKWEMFKDYTFEITRAHIDSKENCQILRCRDYTQTENFIKSSIVFNLVLLKKRKHLLIEDINRYFSEYPNMISLNLKILNLNTKTDNSWEYENLWSQWILNNWIQKSEYEEIVQIMDQHFERIWQYDDWMDRFEWKVQDWRKITLYARKAKYWKQNIVVYWWELIDYSLNPVVL